MMPVYFEGAQEVAKPENTTDDQCFALFAMPVPFERKGADGKTYSHIMWLEHWMPSKEDIEAINQGRGIWIQLHCGRRLIPVAMLTLDENCKSNDAD